LTRVLDVRNKMDNCATHSGVTFAVSVKTPDTGLNNYLRKVTKQDRCMSYSEKKPQYIIVIFWIITVKTSKNVLTFR